MTCFLLSIKILQPSNGVYPSVWFFLSATCWLLWLTQKFSTQWRTALNLNFIGFRWLVWSFIAGIGYWFFDGWLVNQLIATDELNKIIEWQQSTINYYPLSLFLGSVIMAPIFEELVFRGLVLNAMKQPFNNWIAVGVSGLLFALIHWSWPEFISLFIIGSIYGWITVKSNSLLPALVAHITHNALTFWQHVSV